MSEMLLSSLIRTFSFLYFFQKFESENKKNALISLVLYGIGLSY